jgi:putative endonuclease
VYYEKFTWIQLAIAKRKEIKDGKETKDSINKTINPELRFLNHLFE